jgi:hypothetical protein
MEFSSRNPQPPVQNTVQHPVQNSPAGGNRQNKSSEGRKDLWQRVGIISAIVAVVILLIGVIALVYSDNRGTVDNESKYIYANKLQAVFLNTGQVYFGNIKDLNNNFMILTNIFYLQTSSSGSSTTSSSSNTNVTLVKLGCELHMPYDQMVINRAQVTFWENLQSGGQVSKAVATYNSEHPHGQSCADQSTSSANTSSSVQNANSNSAAKP